MDGVRALRQLAGGLRDAARGDAMGVGQLERGVARSFWRGSPTSRAQGGRRLFDAGRLETLYIVHLCGERGETRAYAPLCRMIANDRSIGESLGDAVTETLPGILHQRSSTATSRG